jgi:hypothetical protein
MENQHILHAVAFQNGHLWVAQCLEYDIATQASSLPDLLYDLKRTLGAHMLIAREEKLAPFANIPRAPQRFWEMYRQARTRLEAVRPADLPLAEEAPQLEVRAA